MVRFRMIGATAAALLSCVLLLAAGPAGATAQQENPLFVQARAIADQVASSQLPEETRADIAQKFASLAAEQQSLWQLAGQVDSGQCADGCAEDYNGRVVAWQGALVAFSAMASAALPQGSAQVTMDNRTGQTLDLFIDGQDQCQALFNLTCTAQTGSGFHVLTAESGGQRAGAETVNLKPGESYTFTVQ